MAASHQASSKYGFAHGPLRQVYVQQANENSSLQERKSGRKARRDMPEAWIRSVLMPTVPT